MLEALITLVSVTALLLGAPGPAPLALAATGASFGARKGLPFLAGILAGLLLVVVGAIAGLGALFVAYPSLKLLVQLMGAAYLCYIAWRLACAPISSINTETKVDAPSFRDGFILNILNPKAYAAFLAIFSQFLLPIDSQSAALFVTGAVCMVVAILVDTAWLCVGGALGRFFRDSPFARGLRVFLAALILLAVIVVLFGT